jgi:hypothetical protein
MDQPDRQNAIHEQWPVADADLVARLHRYRTFSGHPSLRQLPFDLCAQPRTAHPCPRHALAEQLRGP